MSRDSAFLRTALALVLCAASFAPAQRGKPPFKNVRMQVESSIGNPGRLLRALDRVRGYTTPQARKLLLDVWSKTRNSRVQVKILDLLRAHEHATVLRLLAAELLRARTGGHANSAAWGLLKQERAGLDALGRALDSPKRAARQAAIRALGSAARKDAYASRLLQKAVLRLTGPDQDAALTQLRTAIKPTSFLDTLAKLGRSGTPRVRAEALRQLAIAGRLGDVRELLAEFEADPQLAKHRMIKPALVFARLAAINKDTLPLVIEIGVDGGNVLRAELVQLGRFADLRDRFIKVLGTEIPRLERAVERLVGIELIARFKTPAAVRVLTKALTDRSTAVVLAAIPAIAAAKNRAALPALRKLFAGRHPELQLEAMLAIHALQGKDPGWPRQLAGLIHARKIGLRCKAIDLLAELDYRPALGEVQTLASAAEWQVRSAAYGFLAKVLDRSSIPLLIERLQHEDGRLEGECVMALVRLTQKTWPTPALWKRWWSGVAKTFKMPRPERTQEGKNGKSATVKGVLTYYDIPVLTKRACFIVDTSGSMGQPAGTARYPKIKSAKQALIQVLRGCAPDQNFNLMPFSGRARSWKNRLSPMNPANRLEAIAFTQRLRAGGGTNIYAAVKRAFDDMSVDTIYLLSDGAPSTGEITQIDELANAIARWNRDRRIVIHTISFGRDSKLLQRLAKESGGKYVRYI